MLIPVTVAPVTAPDGARSTESTSLVGTWTVCPSAVSRVHLVFTHPVGSDFGTESRSDTDRLLPLASVTFNRTVRTPVSVGVPSKAPCLFSTTPAGRPLADQKYGARPPLARSG